MCLLQGEAIRNVCCQVETVGDAYMVVSGLPKPNAGQHIVEICSMAVDHIFWINRPML